MNGLFQSPLRLTAMPAEFEVLSPPPLLLPGESFDQYHALRHAIFADLAPQSAIEWLLAVEVAELSWEIRRYRIFRHKLLESYRPKAIESGLRCIDMIGIPSDGYATADVHLRCNALSWRGDPTAAREINARLAAYGFDEQAVTVEVYIQAREIFILFEGLLNGAQARRLLLLRDIQSLRERTATRKKPS